MAVHLTRIYTRTGDDGTTALGDMSRVPKTDLRVGAYADTDETNAAVGVAVAIDGLSDGARGVLRQVQNDLFDVGADISVPHGGDRERLRLAPEQTGAPRSARTRLILHCASPRATWSGSSNGVTNTTRRCRS